MSGSPKTPRRSLRGLLVLGLVAAALTPLFLASAYYARFLSAREASASADRLAGIARTFARQTEEVLRTHQSAVGIAAASIAPHADNAPTTDLILHVVLQQFPELRSLLAADRDGALIAAQAALEQPGRPTARATTNRTIADRDVFRKTIGRKAPYVGEPFMNYGYADQPLVPLCAPIFDPSGTLRGVAQGTLNLGSLDSIAAEFARLPGVEILLLSADHRMIYSSRASAPPLTRLTLPLAPSTNSPEVTWFEYRPTPGEEPGREPVLAARAVLRAPGLEAPWVVVAQQDLGATRGESRRFRWMASSALALAFLGTLGAGVQWSRHLVQPLESLTHWTRSITSEPNVRVLQPLPPNSRELAELHSAIHALHRSPSPSPPLGSSPDPRPTAGNEAAGRPAPTPATDAPALRPGSVPSPSSLPVSPPAAAEILVVEDHPITRVLAVQTLDNLGHRADAAASGSEALEILRHRRYRLVLMDCRMPDMDGWETTRRLRSGEFGTLDPNVPVVAVTADDSPECRARCQAAGMNEFLGKPYRLAELASTLTRWLRPGPPADS